MIYIFVAIFSFLMGFIIATLLAMAKCGECIVERIENVEKLKRLKEKK